MTSSTTAKTAANGGTTTETKREFGLRALRELEARKLIDLATDALSETGRVGHEMHRLIYDRDRKTAYGQLQQLLEETLACWEIADHYLRMLDEVIVPDEALSEDPVPFQIT